MKKLFTILGMFVTLHGFAQFNTFETDGKPTISINRKPCIVHEHEGDTSATSTGTRTAATQTQAPLRAQGSPKIVVCLAEFADVKFTVAENADSLKALFNTFFNGRGQGAGNNPYSVYDYFNEMSNGIFTPEFVIMDTVTLSKERKYYGEASGSNRRTTYRNEVLSLLAPQLEGKLSEYDTDSDGRIDGVIIVFPGCGANVGDDDGMHPACWTYSVTNSGIDYATQLVVPELLGMDKSAEGGANEAVLNGIGVYVHEMSHMLGLPDFYDINYKASGMDYWSLMDYGEYWRNGYYPTPYTAYERHYMGWTPLVELSEPTNVEAMKTLAEGGSAYVIYNDGNRDEYYVLENRTTNDEYSRNLCTTLGSGLMIYHVDYSASAWSSNRVNTDVARQRMTIVPANGHFEFADNLIKDDMDKYLSQLRGHLWPLKDVESVLTYWGIAGNNALTDEERTDGDRIAPAARLHTKNTDGTFLMHKPITNIAFDKSTQTISFTFMGGSSTGVDQLLDANGADAMLRVYSLDGRQVMVGRESSLYTLPQGIYVVRNLSTGETTKRFVGRQ